MVGHQAPSMAEPAATSHRGGEHLQEAAAVAVVEKDLGPGVAARGEMIDGARKLGAERTRHVVDDRWRTERLQAAGAATRTTPS